MDENKVRSFAMMSARPSGACRSLLGSHFYKLDSLERYWQLQVLG